MELRSNDSRSQLRAVTMGTRLLRIAAYVSTIACLAAGQVAGQLSPERPRHDPVVISPELAAELEAQLARDPGNQRIHTELLVAYSALSQPEEPVARAKFCTQVVWFVTNHPESSVLDAAGEPFWAKDVTDPRYQELESLWVDPLAKFPESAHVLYRAGRFFRAFEGGRAIDLFKKASRLEPYAVAEEFPGYPLRDEKAVGYGNLSYEVAESLRQELVISTDPELLSGVGLDLARLAVLPGFDNNALIILGQQLMERAVAIDPGNPRWSKAIEEARMPLPPPPPGTAPSNVFVRPDQMEKRLTKKVDPVYPPEAIQAHVQGSVVFYLQVDKDGFVRKANLSWGEPLLVDAAREAVLQYRYKPYIENGVQNIENGTAIAVGSMVKVTFTLPADPKPNPK
jgi:hypothetical protein